MQGKLMSALVRILFAVLFTSFNVHAATEINSDYAGALWVAKTDGVLKLATADGHVLFEISDADNAQAMAIDEQRGRLWFYGNNVLSAYTFNGRLITSHRNNPPIANSSSAFLAVTPVDGSVWLGSGNNVVHYSQEGEVLSSKKASGIITAITADNDSAAVWVTDTKSAYLVTESNHLLSLQEIYKASSAIQGLQHDEYLQEIWITTGTGLVRIDNSGQVKFESAFKQLKHIAPDHQGAVWAVTGQKVYRMDASGLVEAELNLFLPRDGGEIVAVAADKSDGTVWLANRKTLVHLGLAGESLHEINESKGSAGINALSIFRDLIAPLISILKPADDSLTNNNRPIIEIGYNDSGIGVDGETLRLFVNANEVVTQCETANDGAKCTLGVALPEGLNALSAEVKDYAGNASEKTQIYVRVDTYPPVINVSAPAQDFYTNKADVAITGTISEPATVTLAGKSVTLGPQNTFNYPATLIEGTNSFKITATDLAGNSSTYTLSGTLDTVPPQPAVSGLITVTLEGNLATITGASGSAEPGSWITIVNATTGASVTVRVAADGSFTAQLASTAGDSLIIKVSDKAGNTAAQDVTFTTGIPKPGAMSRPILP